MDEWVFWLILAAVLGVAELLTLTAALGILGISALLTAGFAIALPPSLQLVIFTVASVLGVVLLRPLAARHRLEPPTHQFGVDALIGKPALVTEEVDLVRGRIRIGSDDWTARTFDDTRVIPAGTVVEVIKITGNTALVHPRE